MSKTDSTYNIIIVGGSFAGLGAAHNLLRNILPPLAEASSITYKVTLVSASAYFYFKIAAPRGVVAPSLLPVEKLFLPIKDGFKEYPAKRFEFVQATAVSLDPNTKTLLAAPTSEDKIGGDHVKISYDSILLCTGVTQASNVWFQPVPGADLATRRALEDMHDRIPKAKTILIAGGGPAGTETAGELGSAYGKSKDVTILSGSDRLLPNLRAAIGHDAESRLTHMGVKTIHKLRVVSAKESSGQTMVEFNDGTSQTVDVYIPAVGEKPNSDYIPSDWKNEKGYVKTDPTTLRVTVPGVSHAYTLGSVGSYSKGTVIEIMNSTKPVCETIRVDLFALLPSGAQASLQSKGPSFPMSLFKSAPKPASEHQMPYKAWTTDTQLVPIGRKQGVGVLFGYKLPSWFVWMLKGRNYMIDNAVKSVSGADFK